MSLLIYSEPEGTKYFVLFQINVYLSVVLKLGDDQLNSKDN